MKTLLTGCILLALAALLPAQNTLNPTELVIFKDGAQIRQRGIVRFIEKMSRIDPQYNLIPESIEITHSKEFEISYVKFMMDTVDQMKQVSNWRDVITANRKATISVVYEIGQEFDEVEGEIRMIDEVAGIFVLRTAKNSDVFIPFEQVRQVITDTAASYAVAEKILKPSLEVKMTEEMPFAPIEISGLMSGFTWEASCKFRLVDDKSSNYEMTALVSNDAGDFEDVEVKLSGNSILDDPDSQQQNAEVFSAGKVTFKKGERMILNLVSTAHEYQQVHDCNINWEGVGPSQRSDPIPVIRSLKLTNAASPSVACQELAVYDEKNQLLSIGGIDVPGADLKTIPLGSEPRIKVYYQEIEKKRFPKPVKVGEKMYNKIEISGKITVVNQKPGVASLRLKRELFGEMTDIGKSRWEQSKTNPLVHELSWIANLKSAQSKTFEYEYQAMTPVEE